MKEAPQELPDNEEEYEEMGESITSLKISAIELAIKAAGLAGNPKEPENVLKIARDFYEFIAEDDNE
jgi:hypothetical protein